MPSYFLCTSRTHTFANVYRRGCTPVRASTPAAAAQPSRPRACLRTFRSHKEQPICATQGPQQPERVHTGRREHKQVGTTTNPTTQRTRCSDDKGMRFEEATLPVSWLESLGGRLRYSRMRFATRCSSNLRSQRCECPGVLARKGYHNTQTKKNAQVTPFLGRHPRFRGLLLHLCLHLIGCVNAHELGEFGDRASVVLNHVLEKKDLHVGVMAACTTCDVRGVDLQPPRFGKERTGAPTTPACQKSARALRQTARTWWPTDPKWSMCPGRTVAQVSISRHTTPFTAGCMATFTACKPNTYHGVPELVHARDALSHITERDNQLGLLGQLLGASNMGGTPKKQQDQSRTMISRDCVGPLAHKTRKRTLQGKCDLNTRGSAM